MVPNFIYFIFQVLEAVLMVSVLLGYDAVSVVKLLVTFRK
jgi:hypothetical protein